MTNARSRTRYAAVGAVIGVLAALGGCASRQADDPRPVARCPVCDENADLACVDVRVDDKTPHAEYRGRTYYFCSEECRGEFLRNPAKYASK